MQERGTQEPQKLRRGFAAMSAERQREIASQGGRAAHEQGVAHEWNKDEARAAGKKVAKPQAQREEVQQQVRQTYCYKLPSEKSKGRSA
ncbi:MAG TPA: KGG domain-containing protein [Flavisolibacter sp.]|nr:KGG domain-containing protein [Flavisolibacter sp.]